MPKSEITNLEVRKYYQVLETSSLVQVFMSALYSYGSVPVRYGAGSTWTRAAYLDFEFTLETRGITNDFGGLISIYDLKVKI